ncbi:PQQ-binding-like beta-propeller repeat protein [Actinomadura sp. 9N407]|uniref:outer membrane protein assembly factor BamB family protein n=1 Tax=Actinomadura sp. 9N407 TaxID=3375154 RepID=UPI0037AC7EF5
MLTASGIDVYQDGATRPTRSVDVPSTGVLTVAGGTLFGTPIQHGTAWAYDTRGQRMLWKHELLSSEIRFSAGATGARDLVYIPDAKGGLLAFQPRDGRLAQRRRLPLAARIEVAPVAAGGVVYAGATDRTVYAVDAATGRLRWRYVTGGSVNTPPVVAGRVVHVGCRDGFLYTLRA